LRVKLVPVETRVALLSSERLPHRLPITNGSMVVPAQACTLVPTLRPNLPLTSGSSPNETLLPPRVKPSMTPASHSF
jgi:hypothetical protein